MRPVFGRRPFVIEPRYAQVLEALEVGGVIRIDEGAVLEYIPVGYGLDALETLLAGWQAAA